MPCIAGCLCAQQPNARICPGRLQPQGVRTARACVCVHMCVHVLCEHVCVHVCAGSAGSAATQDAKRLLKQKLDAVAVWNTIIMSQTNCGYLPFAENWLFHTRRLNLTSYVLISEDDAATAYLETHHPGHVISASLLSASRPKEALEQDKFHDFGSASFIRLACARPVYMAAILALGFNVLWIDLDAALLIDPFR